MSKKIILVRHAKSSWSYEVSDKDRPLSERGIVDAHLVSTHFLNDLSEVNAVFSSPANRALHTGIIFLRNLDIPFSKLLVTDELYDFGGAAVSQFLKSINDEYNTILIFGHNHAFTEVVNRFGSIAIENVPTSGLTVINFEINSWKNIDKGITERTIFPKHLRK